MTKATSCLSLHTFCFEVAIWNVPCLVVELDGGCGVFFTHFPGILETLKQVGLILPFRLNEAAPVWHQLCAPGVTRYIPNCAGALVWDSSRPFFAYCSFETRDMELLEQFCSGKRFRRVCGTGGGWLCSCCVLVTSSPQLGLAFLVFFLCWRGSAEESLPFTGCASEQETCTKFSGEKHLVLSVSQN